jgi:hypothetical protein
VPADAHEFAALEEAQELGLHGQGHLRDLVEEQGPRPSAASIFPRARSVAPVNAPLLVAEQLALEQLLGGSRRS